MTESSKRKLAKLGHAGITVSMVYGPYRGRSLGLAWSVNVLTADGLEFPKPFLGLSFDHCVNIAMVECAHRGWLRGVGE